MKELPILFSTSMVQAILEGRKTKTRRLMNPQPGNCNHADYDAAYWKNEPPKFIESAVDPSYWYCQYCGNGTYAKNDYKGIKNRYGQPGDILWVRETWSPDLAGDGENGYVEYINYFADNTRLPIKWVKDYDSYRNRPGIHMNKEYARIRLQVTEVRVERLQDISEEDAIDEGVGVLVGSFKYFNPLLPSTYFKEARSAFFSLWESINGKESLDANPWVWSISFKVLSTTGKPDLKNIKA